MPIDKKQVKDWKSILIDTSIICALFRLQHPNGTTDKTTLFIGKLIDYLSKSKVGNGKERTFLISTITLSELLTRENDEAKVTKIMRALDSNNVEFRSFNTPIALAFNLTLQDKLHNPNLNKRAKDLGWKTGEYMNAREWIIKDYMIAMTGVVEKADALLTVDKNTFYPLCNDVDGANCLLAYPQLFEFSEQFIMSYDYDNVGNFLANIPFKTLNEIKAENPTGNSQASLFGNNQ